MFELQFRYQSTSDIYIMSHNTVLYPVHGANLNMIQPTWSAYPYHLLFLIWYPYHLVFPYMVMLQTFKRKRHCSRCGVAMGCYGRGIVPGAAIVMLFCGRPAADFPRDVCLTVWRNHNIFLLCRHNAVSFLTNIHERRPIARPLERGMGCLLWIQHLIDILLQFL